VSTNEVYGLCWKDSHGNIGQDCLRLQDQTGVEVVEYRHYNLESKTACLEVIGVIHENDQGALMSVSKR